MVVGKYRYKKSYKNNNKSSTSKSKHIECLIVYRSKCLIYPEYPSYIESEFYDTRDIEYTTMDLVEDDQKNEVEKWE